MHGKNDDYKYYIPHGTINTCNGTLKSQTKPYLLPANYLDLLLRLYPSRLPRDR